MNSSAQQISLNESLEYANDILNKLSIPEDHEYRQLLVQYPQYAYLFAEGIDILSRNEAINTPENIALLASNPASAPSLAAGFKTLLSLNKTYIPGNAYRAAIIRNPRNASELARGFVDLYDQGILNDINSRLLIQCSSHADLLGYGFAALQAHNILNDENRGLLVKHSPHAHVLADQFVYLQQADNDQQKNALFNTLIPILKSRLQLDDDTFLFFNGKTRQLLIENTRYYGEDPQINLKEGEQFVQCLVSILHQRLKMVLTLIQNQETVSEEEAKMMLRTNQALLSLRPAILREFFVCIENRDDGPAYWVGKTAQNIENEIRPLLEDWYYQGARAIGRDKAHYALLINNGVITPQELFNCLCSESPFLDIQTLVNQRLIEQEILPSKGRLDSPDIRTLIESIRSVCMKRAAWRDLSHLTSPALPGDLITHIVTFVGETESPTLNTSQLNWSQLFQPNQPADQASLSSLKPSGQS